MARPNLVYLWKIHIFVTPIEYPPGQPLYPWTEVSALLSDSLFSLHRFANAVGFNFSSFRGTVATTPRYILTQPMRRLACNFGAVSINATEAAILAEYWHEHPISYLDSQPRKQTLFLPCNH